MKIIAVDDEFGSLSVFLGEVMDETHVDCHFFSDKADQILAYCQQNDVQAAFLDINMGEISGVELAKRILKIKPNIKIVFVTGTDSSMDSLPSSVRENTLGFIYKPVSRIELKKYLTKIENKPSILTVKAFGGFDCFIDGELVNFSSNKSKELFALLIACNGKSLSMNQAITSLWPDKDLERAKKLYRDAVWRLRATLNSIRFPCVGFGRALMTLDKTNISCDYFDFLGGKDVFYGGAFMPSYDWSFDFQNEIDYISENRKRH